MDEFKGAIIWSRGATADGRATGAHHACQMDGCRGRRITVKWCDGRITYPCTKGLIFVKDNIWRIG